MEKCKKGMKHVGNVCVTEKEYKRFGKFADDIKITKIALIGAITSASGWLIYSGFAKWFGIEDLPSWALILIGIGIVLVTYQISLRMNRR